MQSMVVEKGCVVGVVFSEVVDAIVDVFGLVVVDGVEDVVRVVEKFDPRVVDRFGSGQPRQLRLIFPSLTYSSVEFPNSSTTSIITRYLRSCPSKSSFPLKWSRSVTSKSWYR